MAVFPAIVVILHQTHGCVCFVLQFLLFLFSLAPLQAWWPVLMGSVSGQALGVLQLLQIVGLHRKFTDTLPHAQVSLTTQHKR